MHLSSFSAVVVVLVSTNLALSAPLPDPHPSPAPVPSPIWHMIKVYFQNPNPALLHHTIMLRTIIKTMERRRTKAMDHCTTWTTNDSITTQILVIQAITILMLPPTLTARIVMNNLTGNMTKNTGSAAPIQVGTRRMTTLHTMVAEVEVITS